MAAFRPQLSRKRSKKRFRIKSKLFVRELREAVPLSNLACRELKPRPLVSRAVSNSHITIYRGKYQPCRREDMRPTEDELYEHCRGHRCAPRTTFLYGRQHHRGPLAGPSQIKDGWIQFGPHRRIARRRACSLFKLGETMEAVPPARLASPSGCRRGRREGDSRVRILPRGRGTRFRGRRRRTACSALA